MNKLIFKDGHVEEVSDAVWNVVHEQEAELKQRLEWYTAVSK